MEKDVSIKIEGLKKKYRLGTIGGRTLQGDIQSKWAKLRGKEDPNVKIGVDQRLIGQTFWALNGVDLTVYQGERVGIIGMNGAGKSTLLKIISRITSPTEGEIDIYGRVSSMLEIGIGFHGEMTGRENIYMNGAILGMTKAEIDKKIDNIIEFSEIKEYIDTPVKRYSSGMFVKLAFAVAAHLDSEIMIMDEVLAVGDVAFQKKCIDKMKEIAENEGKTILYVSHNMNTIKRLCDRCIVLDKGKIIFDGDVDEAVFVYLNNNSDEEEGVEFNISDKNEDRNKAISINRVSLKDKIKPDYEGEEKLVMKVDFDVFEPLDNLNLIMTLETDSGEVVGSSFSQDFSVTEKGKESATFVLPLDFLFTGRYFVDLRISQRGIKGVSVLKRYVRVFKFNYKSFSLWNSRYMGNVSLPDMKIEEIF